MSKNTHLTRNQLSALSAGSFREIESDAVQRHLLICDECRGQLPLPSVDQLWAAVLMQNELDADVNDEKPDPIWSPVMTGFSSVWNLRRGLVWTTAGVIILLSVMFFLRMDDTDSKREIVQTFDNKTVRDLKFPVLVQTPDNEAPVSSVNTNQSSIAPIPGSSNSNLPKQKVIPDARPNILPKKPNENRVIISETRGKTSKCSEQQLLEMETFTEKENYVFKWKKLPKAAKYHIYISDEDEILVDEYETTGETTFVLKKPLDPMKTYKWKIIVTLENGQTIVGDAQKFNLNKFQYNLKKFDRKESLGVRCSANE
jgi:hypothetical protein